MPYSQFPGQLVPVPAGLGVPPHEAGVFVSAARERDGHPLLGEDVLTWKDQVEGEAEGKCEHKRLRITYSGIILDFFLLNLGS